jgi:hypothetical protein
MSAFYDLASVVLVPSGYKSGKIYAQKPLTTDGQLTFTRASTATRVNASGALETVASGVPRLDYSGGATCPKLLLEPQRINRLTQSNNFSHADWTTAVTGAGSTAPILTANYTTSPFGSNDAWRLQATVGVSGYSLLQQAPFISGQHTASLWVKSNTSSNQSIYFRASINETPVTVTPTWTRISVTEANGDYLTIGLRDIAGQTNVSIDISIYAAQLEDGAYPTSIIPTTTAAVTRLADVAIKTGISSLIGQTEGTLFGELKVTAFDPNGFIPVYLKNTSGSNEVYFWFLPDGKIRASVWNTFTQQAEINTSAGYATIGGTYKFALGYKQNDFVFYVNGVQIGTDTNGTVGAMSDFVLTYVGLATYSYPVNLSQALVFKTRLTNAQLAELTTL